MTTRHGLDDNAVVAARALLAVTEILDDVAAYCDERFLESLLLNALNAIPGLGPLMLGCPPEATYWAGQPKARHEADVVAWVGDTAVAQLEVKIRSNINRGDGWNQFDRYAAASAPGTGLFVLTSTHRQAKLQSLDYIDWSRWTILVPAHVHTATQQVSGTLPVGDGSVERLVRSLARIPRPEPE